MNNIVLLQLHATITYIGICIQMYRRVRNQYYLPTLLILECLVCSNPFLPMNDFVSVWRGFPRGFHNEFHLRILGAAKL